MAAHSDGCNISVPLYVLLRFVLFESVLLHETNNLVVVLKLELTM